MYPVWPYFRFMYPVWPYFRFMYPVWPSPASSGCCDHSSECSGTINTESSHACTASKLHSLSHVLWCPYHLDTSISVTPIKPNIFYGLEFPVLYQRIIMRFLCMLICPYSLTQVSNDLHCNERKYFLLGYWCLSCNSTLSSSTSSDSCIWTSSSGRAVVAAATEVVWE